METTIVCLDTSILIDFYRKKDKQKSAFFQLTITKQLKASNKLIEVPDIFIAATACAHKLPLATLNLKHFERIEDLKIINIS